MSLINLIAAVRRAFPEALREQACADLMALDDRSLADIGLRRSDIVAGLCGRTHAVDAVPDPPAVPQLPPALLRGYFPLF